MTELQEKQLAFLEETAGFYNVNNRGLDDTGTCIYSPTSKSPGCAIGRHLDPVLSARLDKGTSTAVNNDVVFPELPSILKDLDRSFLARVQDLHDTAWNWDEKGINACGKNRVLEIKKEFDLF